MGSHFALSGIGYADYTNKDNINWNAGVEGQINLFSNKNGFHSNTNVVLGKGMKLQEKIGYEITLFGGRSDYDHNVGLDIYGKAEGTYYLDSHQGDYEKYGTTDDVNLYNYSAGGGAELIYRTPSSRKNIYGEFGVYGEVGYRKDSFVSPHKPEFKTDNYNKDGLYVKGGAEAVVHFGNHYYIKAFGDNQQAGIATGWILGN